MYLDHWGWPTKDCAFVFHLPKLTRLIARQTAYASSVEPNIVPAILVLTNLQQRCVC
jgi:hypothetical protein